MQNVKKFLKSEIVLVLSFILAVASCFIVVPNKGYIDYIDFKTLVLLFSLMAATAGLNSLGVFSFLAEKLLKFVKRFSSLNVVLCLLCFFCGFFRTKFKFFLYFSNVLLFFFDFLLIFNR